MDGFIILLIIVVLVLIITEHTLSDLSPVMNSLLHAPIILVIIIMIMNSGDIPYLLIPIIITRR